MARRHLGHCAINHRRRIDGDVHPHPQAPRTRRNQPATRCLTNAAIIKLQCGEDRVRHLQQVPFDAEIAESAEVGTHGVPP